MRCDDSAGACFGENLRVCPWRAYWGEPLTEPFVAERLAEGKFDSYSDNDVMHVQ